MRQRYHNVSSRTLFILGWWLLALAIGLAIFATPAHAAKVEAPTTYQVTHRLGLVADRMLQREGMRVTGMLGASCRPGTKGDPTRKVRWWCLLEQRDEVGAVNWRARIRVRAHRGRVSTSVNWRMEGRIQMQLPRNFYLTTSRF